MKYFTADLHIDDTKAIKFPQRRSMTIEEWKTLMFDCINNKVKRSDTLYILGDFGSNPKACRPKIKCKDIYLVLGNHDHSVKQCKEAFGQDKVRDSHSTKICGVETYLLHYPCLVWPASHYGSYSLFGHVHDGRTDFWDDIPYLKDRRALDVCPESYKRHFGEFGIWSEDQIHEILRIKPGHDDVSWYRQQNGPLE